jgi:hypothetical protein
MSGLLRNKFEKHFAFQAVTAPAGIAVTTPTATNPLPIFTAMLNILQTNVKSTMTFILVCVNVFGYLNASFAIYHLNLNSNLAYEMNSNIINYKGTII